MKVVGRKYASVSELIRDTSDAETADAFDKYQADRRMVNCLTVMRCAQGVSQVDLAERMGCVQSKVSKIESSVDADLNFGDIIGYALALKQSIHVAFSPAKKNGADHIRFHVECIKHELNRLVKIAGDDKTIGDGVEALAIETVQSLVTVLEELFNKLPRHAEQANAAVSVEVEGERGQRLPLDAPKRVRKAKAASAT